MSTSDACKDPSELVLVTGASGFIATHCVKILLENGYRVRGSVRSLKDEKKCAPLRKLVENPKYPIELVEADLLNENSWLNAVKDCTFVLHTASPFPLEDPKDENELIIPALDGTLFVLRACAQEGSQVKRVVLTSSVAAILSEDYENGRVFSEKDWSDPSLLTPYLKSKTLAEQAAWNFLNERKSAGLPCFELAVINPSFVMGPILHDSPSASRDFIKSLMLRENPMLPNISFGFCDVRDVALAHLRAMKKPEAAGNRHLIVDGSESHTFKDVALALDAEFQDKGYKVPLTVAPNCIIKILSIFDRKIRSAVPMLGKIARYDNRRLTEVLGIQPINMHKSVVDMAQTMIDKKII